MHPTMTIVEARTRIGTLVEAAHLGSTHTVITQHGKPRAVIVGYDWYLQHQDPAPAPAPPPPD